MFFQSPGAFAALSLTLCCRHGASPSLRPLLCARLEPLGFPQQTESPEEPGGLSDPTSICKGSAEASCSAVGGLFLKGKEDGENQVLPSPLGMVTPSASPKEKRWVDKKTCNIAPISPVGSEDLFIVINPSTLLHTT